MVGENFFRPAVIRTKYLGGLIYSDYHSGWQYNHCYIRRNLIGSNFYLLLVYLNLLIGQPCRLNIKWTQEACAWSR